MQGTLEKQTKTGEIHNYPFDADIFLRTFNGYIRKFNTIFAVIVILVCIPFIVYGIARYLEMTKVDITRFLELWHAGESFLQYAGFSHVVFGMFASGIIAVGNFAFGIIAVGNFAFGVISIGGFLSCGVLSIGGYSSVGVVAIAYSKSYGVIAISTGYQQFIGAEAFSGGQALGFVAIGRHARGVYALNYDEKGKGVYQLSPKRQDPEAVALFTQWFPKLKNTFALPS